MSYRAAYQNFLAIGEKSLGGESRSLSMVNSMSRRVGRENERKRVTLAHSSGGNVADRNSSSSTERR